MGFINFSPPPPEIESVPVSRPVKKRKPRAPARPKADLKARDLVVRCRQLLRSLQTYKMFSPTRKGHGAPGRAREIADLLVDIEDYLEL